MGTVTTYNESTGRWEVKNNEGQVVATASNLRDAATKSKEYIYGGKEGEAYTVVPQEILREGGTYAVPSGKPQPDIGEWVDSKTGLGYSGYQKSPADMPAGIPNPVSISVQEAYKAGALSKTAMENYEKAGTRGLIISQESLMAAKEARKTYPLDSLPETHSSLQMVERQQRSDIGMKQQEQEQEQDIIKREAAQPFTQLLYHATEGNLLIGSGLSLVASRLEGESFSVFQEKQQGKIESFTGRGFEHGAKKDETWVYALTETRQASATLAMILFPEAGMVAFAGMGIMQGIKTIKEPSRENMVETFLYGATALVGKSVEVMGGSMLADYAKWKAPKLEVPKAKGFSLKGTEIKGPEMLAEDTGLIVRRSTYEKDVLKTSGNIFIITEDVGKISTPTIESRNIAFDAITKLTKDNVAETTITFGEVSKPAMKPFEAMTGGGEIRTIFNERFEVDISEGKFVSLGRTGQKTLYGKELPKIELSNVKTIGNKVGEFSTLDLMQVRQARNQPTINDMSTKLIKIDTLFKGSNAKEMFEIDWFKGGSVKLSKSGLSAFQEKLKTQPFESLPRWPEKIWKEKWEVPANWPDNMLKLENIAKLQKGLDEALKSLVTGVTKNRPGVEIKDVSKLDTSRIVGGLGKGFMKKLNAEVPEVETGEAFNVRPGDIGGMEIPELKDVPELRIGRAFNVGHLKSVQVSDMMQEQAARKDMMVMLNMEKESKLTSITKQGIMSRLKEDTTTLAALKLGTLVKTKQVVETKLDVATLLGLKTKQKTSQLQTPGMKLRPIEMQTPRPTIKEPPTRMRGFTLPSMGGGGREKRKTPGFKVLVKRMGRWFELLDRPVSKSQAYGFGARYANETPGASFRLVKVGTPVEDVYDPTWVRLKNQFRPPKAKSRMGFDIHIERNKFRINTPGEYQGITEKGIAAGRMLKNKFTPSYRKAPKFKEPTLKLGKIGNTKELMFGKERKKKKRRNVWA